MELLAIEHMKELKLLEDWGLDALPETLSKDEDPP